MAPQSDARKQFLEKAKAESAAAAAASNNNVDEALQIGEEEDIPTELQFGVKDGKTTDEAITHASQQLFKRSTINGMISSKIMHLQIILRQTYCRLN